MTSSTRSQNLLDCLQQSIAVGEHDVVKLASLLFVDLACFERFQIQPDGCDGSLEFVSDGVNERVVLLVAAYFADQERRVEHQSEDDQVKKDDSQNEQRDLAPVENNPTHTQRHRERNKTRAQRDEERDGFAATWSYAHHGDCSNISLVCGPTGEAGAPFGTRTTLTKRSLPSRIRNRPPV